MPRRVIDRREASPLARCKNPGCNAPMDLELIFGLVILRCSMCQRRETVTDVVDQTEAGPDGWFHWQRDDDE